MPIPYRTLVFAACLVAALGAVSAWIYVTPDQVRLRMERSLSRVLRSPVEIEGCSASIGGSTRIAALSVAASPPLGARSILAVGDLSVGGRLPVDAGSRAGGPAASQRRALVLRAREATLSLQRRAVADGGAIGNVWNFSEVLRGDETALLLRETALHATIGTARVRYGLVGGRDGSSGSSGSHGPSGSSGPGGSIGPGGSSGSTAPGTPQTFEIVSRGATVRSVDADSLRIEGDLDPSSDHRGGRLEVDVTLAGTQRAGSLRARGSLRAVPRPGVLIGLLDPRGEALFASIDAIEPVDLEIRDLSLSTGSLPRLRAVLRHFDSTLRAGSLGVEIRHLRGTAVLDGWAMRFGGKDGPPAEGKLWGIPAELSGSLGVGDSDIVLTVTGARIEEAIPDPQMTAAGLPASLRAPLDARGVIDGQLAAKLRRDGSESWSAEFRFRDLSSGRTPWLPKLAGSLSARRSFSAVGREGGRGDGTGKIVVDALTSTLLDPVAGEVPFTWDDDELRFTFYLQVGDDPTERASGEAGSIFGTIGWNLRTGGVDADFRCMAIDVNAPLFLAEGVSGEIRLSAGDSAAVGVLSIGSARVPAGRLHPEVPDLVFEGGRCVVAVDAGGVRIETLRLVGPGYGLRAVGTVDVEGVVDLVIFLAEAPRHLALNALPDESRPPDWLAVAGEGFRAFRVTGTFMAPSPREIGAQDRAFLRGG